MARSRFGWLFGFLIGGLVGMLFAPRAGKELRARVKASRREGELGVAPLKDDLKNVVNDIVEVAREVSKSDAISSFVEASKKKIAAIKENLSADFAAIPEEPLEGFEVRPLKSAKKVRAKKKRV